MSRILGCHAHGSAWDWCDSRKSWPLKAVAMATKGSFAAQSSLIEYLSVISAIRAASESPAK
jgi:hypothetical protein